MDVYLKRGKIQILLCIVALIVGIVTGCIDALFGIVLTKLTTIREQTNNVLLFALPLAAVILAYIFHTFGGKCNKGMRLLFEVDEGKEEKVPTILIPFMVCGTWLTHFVGGSAGREGVAMQIGATVSTFFADKLHIENVNQYLLPIGFAAGFAGLFQTPLASILFAMEVLVSGEIRYPALLPCIVSAFVASFTSHLLGLSTSAIPISLQVQESLWLWIGIVILGIVFGFVGNAFSYCMHVAQNYAARKFSSSVRKAFVLGIVLMVLLVALHRGRYSGAGGNLITLAMQGGTVYPYDWLFKFAITILTMCTGLVGGEVVPLFTIGTTLGVVLGPILGVNPILAGMLGYCAVFSSGTNTFLAALFIGGEIFGFIYMPYIFVVCAVAFVCNQNHSIYHLQKLLFVNGRKK